MEEEGEITICPHCGSNLSDPDNVRPMNRAAILSWTGKQMCPNCHYYGFFISVPRSQHEKMQFPNKEVKLSRKAAEKQMFREGNSWLVAVIFITVLAALAYFLVTM
ncbi:hypothetical protein GF412_04015 [Candidatus Micrarchaeota archaeon]|nr:hypothetical protein [Candidatus Micrarchaeota archaeon]MBD3418115.1 hypothetical protein [Candidatus Micrarchaeota archaeon]